MKDLMKMSIEDLEKLEDKKWDAYLLVKSACRYKKIIEKGLKEGRK